MILWLPCDRPLPTSAVLEQFLFSFRDRYLSDLILQDCDIAYLPLSFGALNLIIPRSAGCLTKILPVWHLYVAPFYKYTDILVTPHGYVGDTEAVDGFMRARVRLQSPLRIEALDIWGEPYEDFLNNANGLIPWFVRQKDETLRFSFEEPNPTSRHWPLRAEMSYCPSEYLNV